LRFHLRKRFQLKLHRWVNDYQKYIELACIVNKFPRKSPGPIAGGAGALLCSPPPPPKKVPAVTGKGDCRQVGLNQSQTFQAVRFRRREIIPREARPINVAEAGSGTAVSSKLLK
jgi:hypothetical protein